MNCLLNKNRSVYMRLKPLTFANISIKFIVVLCDHATFCNQ